MLITMKQGGGSDFLRLRYKGTLYDLRQRNGMWSLLTKTEGKPKTYKVKPYHTLKDVVRDVRQLKGVDNLLTERRVVVH